MFAGVPTKFYHFEAVQECGLRSSDFFFQVSNLNVFNIKIYKKILF